MAPKPQKPDPELVNAPAEWRSWVLFKGRLVVLPDGTYDLADAVMTKHRRPDGQR